MNIIEGIQQQCERVRGILPYYEEIGPAGMFGLTMLKAAIKEGEASIASDDVVRMLAAYKELEGCKA
jgi:hypothetical protein